MSGAGLRCALSRFWARSAALSRFASALSRFGFDVALCLGVLVLRLALRLGWHPALARTCTDARTAPCFWCGSGRRAW
ncbi:hypothetical protein HYPSUDRAFT_43155 [Hypholoma sublateritium FD-334 SS-4]|uniref:Uncharacterized protein n=1 Tax=Hypholoma sublateritium (strain FD-334 SS-4) TaxID=945553 RepID=A0A0D2NV94_HYPSF|nr:hypothetical protein HYPSUDRAFT_43155 [Hypholoma sublateritium FD-334 SS-4]